MPKNGKSKSLENVYISEAYHGIYAEIAFVKRKMKLVEGERRSNYERNEEELKKNEVVIEELRQKVTNSTKQYEELRKSKEDYTKAIAEAFRNEKRANVFRGKTFEETEEILESFTGDSKNKFNLCKYQKEEMKRKLRSLLKEEQQLERAYYGGNKNVAPMLNELRRAENDAALMQMRITEAENVQAKYRSMLDTLKQENYSKSNQLRDMEETIQNQKKETKNVKQALREATKARQAARAKLTEVEEKTMKDFEEREEKLLESRVHLREIRGRMEEIGSKLSFPKYHMAHRDSSLADGLYLLGPTSALEDVKAESTLEEVYQRLVDLTGETDPNAIVTRFHQQRIHAKELEEAEVTIKSRVRKEKLRKNFLENKLSQLQFSGGVRRELLDKEIEEVDEAIQSTEEQKIMAEKRIQDLNEVMEDLLKKIHGICIQNDIPETEDANKPTADRIKAVLTALFEKVEEAIREQTLYTFPSPMLSPDNEQPMSSYCSSVELNLLDGNLLVAGGASSIASSRQPDFDRLRLSPYPSRAGSIKGEIQGRTRSMNDLRSKSGKQSESSEEEEAASRGSIKRQSQVVVEAKTRKGRFKPPSTPGIQRRAL